jgi:hypothetical protein
MGFLVGLAGAALGYFCIRMILGTTELGGGAPTRFCWPLLVLAAFLCLVGLSLVALALVPTQDTLRGPPRGFAALTRAFDGFWAIIRKTTERL